ncbi:MAG: hypothetical protein U0836_21360 [Pirellulales bacterium]
MLQEIIYTSAAQGLKPGSRGFCTVMSSPGMPVNLAQQLEALSGYRHLFPPQDPQAALNPTVYAHLRLNLAGRPLHVLSRIADAGLDYSQRTNKFAHHLVLDAPDCPPGGPAWALAKPGLMATDWDGQPRVAPVLRKLPRDERPEGPCTAWEARLGDAGWAGVLAETAAVGRSAVLLFEPGMEVLPLFVESLSLLPPAQRWTVTFSTFFTRLPPGVNCQWRAVLAGSAEARALAAGPHLVIDLRKPRPAPNGLLVETARTGEAPEQGLELGDEDYVVAEVEDERNAGRGDDGWGDALEPRLAPPPMPGKRRPTRKRTNSADKAQRRTPKRSVAILSLAFLTFTTLAIAALALSPRVRQISGDALKAIRSTRLPEVPLAEKRAAAPEGGPNEEQPADKRKQEALDQAASLLARSLASLRAAGQTGQFVFADVTVRVYAWSNRSHDALRKAIHKLVALPSAPESSQPGSDSLGTIPTGTEEQLAISVTMGMHEGTSVDVKPLFGQLPGGTRFSVVPVASTAGTFLLSRNGSSSSVARLRLAKEGLYWTWTRAPSPADLIEMRRQSVVISDGVQHRPFHLWDAKAAPIADLKFAGGPAIALECRLVTTDLDRLKIRVQLRDVAGAPAIKARTTTWGWILRLSSDGEDGLGALEYAIRVYPSEGPSPKASKIGLSYIGVFTGNESDGWKWEGLPKGRAEDRTVRPMDKNKFQAHEKAMKALVAALEQQAAGPRKALIERQLLACRNELEQSRRAWSFFESLGKGSLCVQGSVPSQSASVVVFTTLTFDENSPCVTIN